MKDSITEDRFDDSTPFTARRSSTGAAALITALLCAVAAAPLMLYAARAGAQEASVSSIDFETDPDADVTIQTAVPGFDVYNTNAIIGVEAGRSYIRLANMRDEGPVTNYVEVWGQDDQEVLASFEVQVPAKASVQFQPELMVQTFAPVNYDQPLVVYVQNGYEKQLWQHVQYDAETGTLGNASVCAYAPHDDYIPPHNVAINVHTQNIMRYASFVSVHNFTDKAGTFAVYVTDSRTGKPIGFGMPFVLDIGPRETFNETGHWYTAAAGFTIPPAELQHINIEFVPKAPDTGARVIVGHVVADLFEGSAANMSNPCPLTGGLIQLPPEGEPQ